MLGSARLAGVRPGEPVTVLDIDGVLADVRHRLHHLASRPKDWDAFFAAADDDEPLPDGLELAAAVRERTPLVLLSGRPEWLRDATDRWLARHGVGHDGLELRPAGDRRPATVVKVARLRAIARANPVALVVDDDPEVVEAIARAGFAARLATWGRPDAPVDERRLRRAQERDGRT